MISYLPHLNAFLNGASAVLLVAGYRFIRQKKWRTHRGFMLSATLVSGVFLISYVVYHAQRGSVHFQKQGWVRPVYFSILISHTILAAAVVPLVVVTLGNALAGKVQRHRRIARWTFPVWLYVSVTGVIIYFMLYH